MGDYSVFAETGAQLMALLSEKISPEMVADADIRLAAPGEQQACRIGIYLYDIKEDKEIACPEYGQNGHHQLEKTGKVPLTCIRRKVPKIYSLFYLIYVNPNEDKDALDMQELLGRITQILNDSSIPGVHMAQQEVNPEERALIWQAVNKPYQIGLFYKLSPIVLSSEIVLDVPLVQEAYFQVEEKEEVE